jgi:hypothetical protein
MDTQSITTPYTGNENRRRIRPRTAAALGIGLGLAALVGAGAVRMASPAVADPGNGTAHIVVQETDYFPKPGDDPSTFWGIFSLDGACGYSSARLSVSDTETFFIAQHMTGATGYKYNSVGKINDEAWTFTPVAADGTTLPTFEGTADEVATAVGIDNGSTALSVNYSFHGTATNTGGQRINLVVKGILRTDADHNITRFDWGVQTCTVN